MLDHSAPYFLIPLAFMVLYVFVACCLRLLGKLSDRAWAAQCERQRLFNQRAAYLQQVRSENSAKSEPYSLDDLDRMIRPYKARP